MKAFQQKFRFLEYTRVNKLTAANYIFYFVETRKIISLKCDTQTELPTEKKSSNLCNMNINLLVFLVEVKSVT